MPVVVSLRGDRAVRKLLDSLSGRELQNRTRRATRAGAAVMRAELRRRVGGSQYPRSFARIATRTSTHGGIRTQTGPTSPLLNIFEGGAEPHAIGARGQRLVNLAEGFAARGPVPHPGMAARPLIAPTFDASHDDAADKAMAKLTEGLR